MADQLIKNALEKSVRESRQAIDEYGVSETAMQAIQKALRKLASTVPTQPPPTAVLPKTAH